MLYNITADPSDRAV